MVSECMEETVIVAAFRRADLVRLHALLVCYESPFQTTGEAFGREQMLARMKRCVGTWLRCLRAAVRFSAGYGG